MDIEYKPLPEGTITEARKLAEEWLKDRPKVTRPVINPHHSKIQGSAEAMGGQELPKSASEIINAPSALDIQQGGNHYKDLTIQPVEYITKNKLGFLEGNIIKYATRYKSKNGAEDIRKIIHYAQLILELEYDQS